MKLGAKCVLFLTLPFLFGFTNIAHRGDNELGRYAEHSFEAYDHAVANQADYLELDLQKTKDNVLVVSHDDNLGRVFGIDKKISQNKYRILRQYRNHSGEPIHSLQEVFSRYQPDSRIKFMIETKDEDGSGGMESTLVKLVNKYHLQKRVLFESFSLSSLNTLAKLAPNIPRTQLGGDYHDIGKNQYFANGFYDKQAASFLRKHHKGYMIWGVNTKTGMHKLLEKHTLSGILTDFPNKLEQFRSMDPLLTVSKIKGEVTVQKPFAIIQNGFQILPKNSKIKLKTIRAQNGILQYGIGHNQWVNANQINQPNYLAPQERIGSLHLKREANLWCDPNGEKSLGRRLRAGSKWNYFAISKTSGHKFYNLGSNQWLNGDDVIPK